jgi:hypothetical protein
MQANLESATNHSIPTEDRFTKEVETYTAEAPSTAFLAVAVSAMAISLLFQVTGRGKWGNFFAQWAPTWLIIGVYNKLVKLEGHDHLDNPQNRSGRRASSPTVDSNMAV